MRWRLRASLPEFCLLIGGSCAVLGVPMIKPGSVDLWIGVAFAGIAAGCGYVAFLIVYKGVLRK